MASLKEIRRRIHSIDNIEQITKSMEMIAAARFQKAQAKAGHSNNFAKNLRDIVQRLVASQVESTYPLLRKGKGTKTAVVIASADRGLCGAYNSNLFNAADLYLKDLNPNDVELVVFGRKGIDYYSRRKWPISNTISDWGGKITISSISKFASLLTDKFLQGEWASIRLIYTKYLTIFSRQVINIPFLPIEAQETNGFSKRDYIFEPAVEELFDKLFPRYFLAEIQNMLNQAYASELAARVCAMRSASKNAEEIKEKLTLERNKLRQTSITKEVLEISSGAEAL